MRRLLTVGIVLPFALAAIFLLPPRLFFLVLLVVVEVEVFEFLRLVKRWAPSAPAPALYVLTPAVALLLAPGVLGADWLPGALHGLAVATLLSVGVGLVVLFGRTAPADSVSAFGILGFGTLYFALPLASFYYLRLEGGWMAFLLVAIVWLGDTAAYYCGRTWGRHKLAPVVSPKKTWEGAAGSLATALVVAAIWSHYLLGGVEPRVLLLAAVTSVSAQAGDLVESTIKRGANIKDSGVLLPGHGGMLDRLDALMFAAPVMLFLTLLLGIELPAR